MKNRQLQELARWADTFPP